MAIEDENNDYPDTISKILPLEADSTTEEEFDEFYPNSDHDWVPVQLVAGQTYDFTIRGMALVFMDGFDGITGEYFRDYFRISFVPDASFRDSSGKIVSIANMTSHTFYQVLNEEANLSIQGITFTFTAPKSETLYVDISYSDQRISNNPSTLSGTYDWSLHFNKSVDQYVGNASTTGQLILSSNNLHTISSAWELMDGSDFVRPDADWFKTSLQAGQSYTVALTSKTNAALFTNNLSVVNSQGKGIAPIQKSDDSISFIAPQTGEYYINAHTEIDHPPVGEINAEHYGYILLGQQNTPIGTSQNDVLKGAGGADLLYGRAGNDTLAGNSGNDILNGGTGRDVMIGGMGNDTYYVDHIRDVVKETDTDKTAIDSIFSSVSYTLPNNVENLTLRLSSQNQKAIIGSGNQLDNTLSSFVRESTLKGGAGNDTLISSDTATLFGETGNDNLIGFGLLVGGTGNDNLIGFGLLVGGTGKDVYTINQQGFTRVKIDQGDSLPDKFDVIKSFELTRLFESVLFHGTELDLKNKTIENNITSANGKDVGMFHSHHIKQGLISFGNLDVYNKPLTVSSATVADAIKYVQANITKSVAFTVGTDTYVFQDGGVIDTLVQLVGVTATGIDTQGLAKGSIYLV